MDLLVHARCNYWLDRPAEWFRAKEKKGYFITNVVEDIHVLYTLGVPIKSIVYVAQDADEALEVLELVEEKCPDGACRIVEGNIFDVAYEYKRQVVGFFNDSEEVPSEKDLELFGRLFKHLEDNTYVGFRFPSKPLPPVLAQKAEKICATTYKRLKDLDIAGMEVLRSSSADFSTLLSNSVDPFHEGNKLRTAHYYPTMFMTETIDGVPCETSGGMYVKKQLGESVWGFQDRVKLVVRPRMLDIDEESVNRYFDEFFIARAEEVVTDLVLDEATLEYLSQMHGLPKSFFRERWRGVIHSEKGRR